ncbi:MAG: potassium-transporting ATPase subunit C [Candidatus Melainabacteria bacterium RIFOXYA12_FULL_32_12]|nr:MAG: potassium-transporting ATPase subunit C [Candidatus Melainabacteria bacterium RIFOXYA12_FULL_32_12]
MKELIKSIKIYLIFTILLGLVYPLAITAIAQITMPHKANGSLIKKDGSIVGSELIGQSFTKPEYFQSRPSAVDYNAAGSGASNLGPSSKKLMSEVKDRVQQVREENNLKPDQQIPADMVLSSSSGLDPHISQENALFQVSRISQLRKIPKYKIKELIKENTDSDFIGIWGQSGVNILKLNLALDNAQRK